MLQHVICAEGKLVRDSEAKHAANANSMHMIVFTISTPAFFRNELLPK